MAVKSPGVEAALRHVERDLRSLRRYVKTKNEASPQPRLPVGVVQRYADVSTRLKEQRHVRQLSPHRDRLDLCGRSTFCLVGSQRQRFFVRLLALSCFDRVNLGPERTMRPPRIVRPWREQIDHQQMVTLPQSRCGFLHKPAEGEPPILISRRNVLETTPWSPGRPVAPSEIAFGSKCH